MSERSNNIVTAVVFPNSFESWHETHFEVVSILSTILSGYPDAYPEVLAKVYNTHGRGGLYELARDLTNKFEELNKDRVWDGEFFDEVDQFVRDELS